MDMQNNNLTKKGDFVELKFTGLIDGKVFDSNIPEDLKALNDKAVPEKTLLIIGQKMVVSGLDDYLESKELNKQYTVSISPNKAFGLRKRDLVKTIPLKIFHAQKIQPIAGASFVFDNQLARVIAVSGARVITDFNNPLAGKEITYKFTISRRVEDLKEKTETACKLILRYVPQIEVENDSIVIKGPKILESVISQSQNKFKEFLGKEVSFKIAEMKKSE